MSLLYPRRVLSVISIKGQSFSRSMKTSTLSSVRSLFKQIHPKNLFVSNCLPIAYQLPSKTIFFKSLPPLQQKPSKHSVKHSFFFFFKWNEVWEQMRMMMSLLRPTSFKSSTGKLAAHEELRTENKPDSGLLCSSFRHSISITSTISTQCL